jgi:4-aminobutyrate aminotransferase
MVKQNRIAEGDVNISPQRKAWQERNVSEEARKWLAEDEKYFIHQSLSTPCLNVMVKCEGAYIEDINGKRYLDFHGNNVHGVGFNNRKVIDAIKAQIDELAFCTRRYTNIPAIRLAKKLAEIAPDDLSKCLFCPGGTDAIEMAIKLARGATKRFKTISMWDSFHGASIGSISVGGQEIFRGDSGPLLPGTEHVPPPDCYHCPFGYPSPDKCHLECAKMVRYVLEKEGDIAAVISETTRSVPYIPPKEYWKEIRKACDDNGALLILDEITSFPARAGKMFSFQNYDIVPDIVAIGKTLGGGILPFAGIIARERLDVMGNRAIGHYTHEKNPVCCAAALATIEFVEENKLEENARIQGDYALSKFNEMKDIHWLIGDVRGMGLLFGVELVKDRETRERACEEAETVMYKAMEKGLSFKVAMGNVLVFTPALTINRKEMDEAINIIDECLGEVERGSVY